MPVTVTPLAPAARFSLRLRPEEAPAVADAFGAALPTRIGRMSTAAGRRALCLGPDEWLLLAEEADGPALAAAFASLDTPHALANLSDRELAWALEGAGVLDLLATGCPLDLARMPVGTGTRTVFDTVQVVLIREAETRFRLEAWRSFAPHLEALFALAGRELALGI